MRTSALLREKIFGFFEFYGVSAQTGGRGVEPVRIFCRQKGREVNFSRICADVFYGRFLMPCACQILHQYRTVFCMSFVRLGHHKR